LGAEQGVTGDELHRDAASEPDELESRLKQVVPWGRSFAEYVEMFSLSESDLGGRILDCGGGPASFNAEATARGLRVVSFDPIYAFTVEAVAARVEETYDVIMAGVEAERDRFVWDRMGSPARLGEVRLAAMHCFLEDFDAGLREERYIAASLPSLPFETGEFDLALCSHLLFLYSDGLSRRFHVDAIEEMLRVAGRVRVFPLLDMGGRTSAHLRPVIEELRTEAAVVRIVPTPYEFQRGGDRMLVVEAVGAPAHADAADGG